MGFGHRVYRAEDPRARLLRGTARELGSPRFEVAEELERVALAELQARSPDRVLATNVEFWSAVVLDVAGIPPALAPAMFACSRTAGWSAHILEQKRLGRLVRPSARYVGPGRPLAREPRVTDMDLAQAATLADEYAQRGLEKELATLRGAVGRRDRVRGARPRLPRPRRRVPGGRPVPLPAEARAAAPRAARTRAPRRAGRR